MRKYDICEKRGKALQSLRRMLRRETTAKTFDPETLERCAERIEAADGETEAVQLIRKAKGLPAAEACSLLRKAEHICFVIGDRRRREVAARNVSVVHGRPAWNRGLSCKKDSPEDILNRIMDVADNETAVLTKTKYGDFVVSKAASVKTLKGEVVGYYDIRADSRWVLADIKEAMA